MRDATANVPFGSLLRSYRLAAGLTQEALAERTGVAARTLQTLERGLARPRRETVRRLIAALSPEPSVRAQFEAATSAPRWRKRQAASETSRMSSARGFPPGLVREPAMPTTGSDRRPPWATLTSFVGRERELADLDRLQAMSRLLTLIGPGGCGKTRLAVELAARLAPRYRDGVRIVSLASAADPDLVPSLVVETLGIPTASGEPPSVTAARFIRGRQMLLVLDNFEHLLPAGLFVVGLLAACSRLAVIVTSREVLRLQGEQVYPVPPLTQPDRDTPPCDGDDAVASVAASEAGRLFVERGQAAEPAFRLDAATAPAVAEICQRLDGLPLAIELAAARIRTLPPRAMLRRMERRLPLLTGGARDLPARQRTLRDAIAWSHDLLAPGERTLFRQLGVFRGWSVEAANRVCGRRAMGGGADLLDVLESLVSKSLVGQRAGSDGDVRFTMLETIREYALEQLEASGELIGLRRRHAEYFLALAEEAESKSGGVEQRAWLERLETEHDNLRAALGWALAGVRTGHGRDPSPGCAELGLRLAGSLWEFWFVHGHFREGRLWLGTALASCPEAPPALRAKALRGAGQLSLQQGDFRVSMAQQNEALAIYRAIGDRCSAAWALIGIGHERLDLGDYASTGVMFEEALALFRDLGDAWGIAWSLHGLGKIAREHGNYAPAEVWLTEAIARFRDLGDKRGGARTTLTLGHAARIQGDHARAQRLFDTALTMFRDLDNRRGMVQALAALGVLADDRGDSIRALTFLCDALARSRELGDRLETYECLERLAMFASVHGQCVRAARLHGAAEVLQELAGVLPPPTDRVLIERALDSARAVLGPSAFEVARVEGRTMTLEQAIAYALGDEQSA